MQQRDSFMPGMPRPGRALTGLMIAITVIWLSFAIGINWGGASGTLFEVLAGNTRAILHGQVWRLLTAPLLQTPIGARGVSHFLVAIFGLYFLAPRLEQVWGAARTLRFIALASSLAYLTQMLIELALPEALAARVVGEIWYGMQPAIAAIAIAWACTFRGQVVQLFGVFPVSSRTLILLVVGLGLLRLAAADMFEEGLVSPFGGMLFGWLLGGGTPSPLRRAWLRLKLSRLEGSHEREIKRKRARPNPSGLRVIPGGRADDDDKGPDGRWLN